MQSKRCFNCMQTKTQGQVCEHCGHDERHDNASHQLPMGTILQGKYLVGKVLGQGGFGITYLGLDLNLDIPIAIKEYYPTGVVSRERHWSNNVRLVSADMGPLFAENRARFLREAQTLARLEDVPEMVQVKNFFQENNTAYIIMGYVKGITLKDYMSSQGGKLEAACVLVMMQPIMEALERVHNLGLVHRDISPDNIMLQPNGRLRVIDFGAAHTATEIGDKSTQAVLKYGFAPIEQYQNRGHLGPWSDVYALCATIYCCLTNKRPPNVTDRIMGADDFYWDEMRGLTQQQKAALKAGLELQYTQRIQSMAELRKRLFSEEAGCYNNFAIDKTVALERDEQQEYFTAVNRKPFVSSQPSNRPVKSKRKHLIGRIAMVILMGILASLVMVCINMQKPVKGTGVLMEAFSQSDVFDESIYKEKILYITFLRNTTAPKYALDVSEGQDGSVMAWVEDGGTELYIAAKDTIIAPENCDSLFEDFPVVKGIRFHNNFDTSNVYSMNSMFGRCRSLQKLDLSSFDTSKVENMGHMFFECESLQTLNLTGWDTSNVQDMSYMFVGTRSMKNVNMPLDVSSVTTYVSFMDSGDTINGKIWKMYFK